MSAQQAMLAAPVTDADHVQGASLAGVTLVEYGDYECSYCGEASVIVRELQRLFTDSLRFVFRNFPLANVHPHAERAAEVAEAVAVQGHFWSLHDLIFEH
jgi:protein-disulfide isomerase